MNVIFLALDCLSQVIGNIFHHFSIFFGLLLKPLGEFAFWWIWFLPAAVSKAKWALAMQTVQKQRGQMQILDVILNLAFTLCLHNVICKCSHMSWAFMRPDQNVLKKGGLDRAGPILKSKKNVLESMLPMRMDDGSHGSLESPSGKVVCRGCFSVNAINTVNAVTSSILAKVPNARLLAWRRDSHPTEKHFCEFCSLMLGSECSRHADEMSQTMDQRICVEELSFEALQRLISNHFEADAGKCENLSRAGGTGSTPNQTLTSLMQPYLEDLLIRRQGFRYFVDALASVADADETLPRMLSELTAKDLFIALLLATPNQQKRIRLATAYLNLKVPLPLIFRHPERIPGRNGTCKAKVQASFELLQEVACVPREGRLVVMSLGTEQVIAGGKTTLLGAMGFASAPEDLDVRPSGPMHNFSCDLFCSDSDLWLLDVHGAFEDEELRNAVLAISIWGSAVVLVHCSVNDFHSTGSPRKELAGILGDLGNHVILRSQMMKTSGVVILIRDISTEGFAPKRQAIESALQQLGVLAVFNVEDCRNFRSATRRAATMERLRARLEDIWKNVLLSGTSCLEDLQRVHVLVAEGHLRREISKLPGEKVLGASELGQELTNLLDRASKESLYESLFPLTAIKRPLFSANLSAQLGF